MTTRYIVGLVNNFNKDRKIKLDVLTKSHIFTIREIIDKKLIHIGTIYYRTNHSNCGLADLHNLHIATQKNANLIIEFIKFYAKVNRVSVLLYNTSSHQHMIKKALKENGFYNVPKKFRNKGSRNGMEFHMIQL